MSILLTIMAIMVIFILGHIHGAWYERLFGQAESQKIADQEASDYYAGIIEWKSVVQDDQIDSEYVSQRISKYRVL